MEIDVLIDKLTDCLVERETNRVVETEYRKRTLPIKASEYRRWKFKWNKPEENGYDTYELFLKGDETIQGRIALKIDGGVADVDIVESAPHNFGNKKRYVGVGGHLFAIACQLSFEAGCDGYVSFTAKNDLIEHYKKELGAKVVAGQRMYIDEQAARALVEKYLER